MMVVPAAPELVRPTPRQRKKRAAIVGGVMDLERKRYWRRATQGVVIIFASLWGVGVSDRVCMEGALTLRVAKYALNVHTDRSQLSCMPNLSSQAQGILRRRRIAVSSVGMADGRERRG